MFSCFSAVRVWPPHEQVEPQLHYPVNLLKVVLNCDMPQDVPVLRSPIQSVETDQVAAMMLPPFVPFWLSTLARPHQLCERRLDVVEVFSGAGQLSAACREKGFQVRSFDREHSPREDLGNSTGLESVIRAIMSLKFGGLLWLAPPCKNWVFLSMPQHKRRRSNAYLGENPNRQTREANSLVYVVAALVRLAVARGVHYILEQPINSRMLLTACMTKATRMTQAATITTYLAAFCKEFPCSKGLHLCGTAPILKALRRNPPPPGRRSEQVYTKDDFSGAVSGGPDLEQTQHYPLEFGRAATSLICECAAFFLVLANL